MRRALAERRPAPRSVPAGRARAAWTWVTEAVSVAICVSGRGGEAARDAASFWAHRAAAVVLLGAGGGTGLVEPPAILVDGAGVLAARLGAAAATVPGAPAIRAGRIVSVLHPPTTEEARASLRLSGIAAVDGEAEAWRLEAGRLGISVLAVRALTAGTSQPFRLERLLRPGSAGWPPLRAGLAVLRRPSDLGRIRGHDAQLEAATLPAARLVAAALAAG